MIQCPACKAMLADNVRFCLDCGFDLSSSEVPEEPAAEEPVAEEPVAEEPAAPEEEAPEEEAPEEDPFAGTAESDPNPDIDPPEEKDTVILDEFITGEKEPEEEASEEEKKGMLATWQYFLLELLFFIPVIGTVFLFIWSIGHPKNESLHRFASSKLIWRLIVYVLLFVALLILLFTVKKWGPAAADYVKRLS